MCQQIVESDPDNIEYIPSADHPFLMEGQGTIALEMLEQVFIFSQFLPFENLQFDI